MGPNSPCQVSGKQRNTLRLGLAGVRLEDHREGMPKLFHDLHDLSATHGKGCGYEGTTLHAHQPLSQKPLKRMGFLRRSQIYSSLGTSFSGRWPKHGTLRNYASTGRVADQNVTPHILKRSNSLTVTRGNQMKPVPAG